MYKLCEFRYIVRLGTVDKFPDEGSTHVDVRIVRQKAHPNFANALNDIGLLFLEHDVEFTGKMYN